MEAILVIDMPSDCYHCQLHDYEYRWCYGKDESSVLTEEDIESKRVEGCPLKPMPSYKAVDLKDTRDVVMFCHGWNTCLNEITGETE